ncbi:MAG: hypothetical protein AAF663_02190 [Planctomycetota bacterium]
MALSYLPLAAWITLSARPIPPRVTLSATPDRLPQLEKLHAAEPADADVTYMLGLEYAKGDGETAVAEALRWLDQTLSLDPGYHYAYFQKAKLLDARGDTEAAHATLDAGLTRARADGHAKAVGELEELKASLS